MSRLTSQAVTHHQETEDLDMQLLELAIAQSGSMLPLASKDQRWHRRLSIYVVVEDERLENCGLIARQGSSG
jgi:hypothetical protein